MSSVSYFAPAFRSTALFGSLDIKSDSSEKQKRTKIAVDVESDAPDSHVIPSISEAISAGSLAGSSLRSTSQPTFNTLEPDLAAQYKTSGQPLNEGIPKGHFPHAFPKAGSYSGVRHRLEDDLAALKPPLYNLKGSEYTAQSTSRAPGLRQRHLAVVTTALHRCVLEGDYVRAGRAFGMLLRSESYGQTFDLRKDGRWGLGAEILLQRDKHLCRNGNRKDRAMNQHDASISKKSGTSTFSPEELEKAKDYYERLVLQYPYRKAFPSAIGPPDFYIAMFSLWIHHVQERHSLRPGLRCRAANEVSDASDCDSHLGGENFHRETLQLVREIVSRLDELISYPPYSDSSKFQRLHGMVNLWMSDLSSVGAPSEMNTNIDDREKPTTTASTDD